MVVGGKGAVCGEEYPKESKTAVHGFATHKATSLQLSQQHHHVEIAHCSSVGKTPDKVSCH